MRRFWCARAGACLAALVIFSALGCSDGRLHAFTFAGDSGVTAGGSGGGTSAGGTAPAAGAGNGSGGGPSGGATGGALPSPLLLDDFEDGDTQSLAVEGGYWYLTPDPTTTATHAFGTEPIDNRPGSLRAMHTRGGGHSVWGMLLGVNLSGNVGVLDASSYSELRFWARSAPNTFSEIRVDVLDPFHFGATIELGSEWREHVLRFTDFTETGEARPINLRNLNALQFFVLSPEAFDFWVDDVAFVR